MVAILTNSPVQHVWDMSIGQIMRYAAAGKNLLPLINPFAGGEEKSTRIDLNDPAQASAFSRHIAPSLGLRRG